MTDEELKKKCTERAKIFQQAMESCHSSSPIDCIEWFADSIAELEKENAELKGLVNQYKASKCGSISLVNRNMIMFDQLTKAKDLLKRCYDNYIYLQPLRGDIEQFLNSEVEK